MENEAGKRESTQVHALWPPNLRVKFTVGIIILGLVLAIATLSVTYVTYRDANLEKYRRIVAASAQMAASLVDADEVERYMRERIRDDAHVQVDAQLQNLLDYNGLTYIYVYQTNLEKNEAYLLHNITKADDPMGEYKDIGLVMEWTEDDTSVPLVHGVVESRRPNLQLNLSVSPNGALASAFVPLIDSKGEVVAVVGADVTVDQMYDELNRILWILSGVIILIIAITVFVFQYYITRTMIRPLQQLVNSAQNFVYNQYENGGQNERIQIHTRDELERLAEAFYQMTEDITKYIKDVTTLTTERQRIAAELKVATKIQESVLPRQFNIAPDKDAFTLYATMNPAKEVGGDFYDFFLLGEDKLCLVIGDVSGKGVPAALFMMMAKSVIRDQMFKGMEITEAFRQANDQLCENNEEGMFVTVLCVVMDIHTGQIVMADAGHGAPVKISASGETEWLKTKRGLVMGGMKGMRYRAVTGKVEPGDVLYLYTDGVSEADNEAKELFGNERIDESLKRNWKGDLKGLLGGVRQDLTDFADGAPQADDITMLAVQFRPDGKDMKI